MIGLLLLLVACAPHHLDKPSGDCTGEGDGSRVCEHTPLPGDQYLPDCQNPLPHEHWRVCAQSAESAYLYPRPDGSTALAELCADPESGLAGLLDPYTLCAASPDIERLNTMDPADALTLARALHERLLFRVVEGGDVVTVDPWPHHDDLAAVCAAVPSPAMAGWCAWVDQREDGGVCNDLGFLPTTEQATAAAEALNAYYGVVAP